MKKEHLEEVALAFLSADQIKIKEVNKLLESNYKKHEPPLTKKKLLTRMFTESSIGQVLTSLTVGYIGILIICFIYVLLTGRDFVIFVFEEKEIVVLGGIAFAALSREIITRIKA